MLSHTRIQCKFKCSAETAAEAELPLAPSMKKYFHIKTMLPGQQQPTKCYYNPKMKRHYKGWIKCNFQYQRK